MTGGVIGVDLFFVLSGFLITALLLQERERNGEVHYPAFYLRRALRLFPALAILLPVVAVAAHLSPGVDKATADLTTGGIPWVALYAANWARATGTQLGLFGHTWSLAIEEQFYLLWPTALFLLVRKRADYSRAVVLALAVAALVAAHRALEWLQGAGIDRVANGTDMRADAQQTVLLDAHDDEACAINALDNPYRDGLGQIKPVAMQRSLRILDSARAAVNDTAPVPCDARGAPVSS